MSTEFSGRAAIITGASSGLGRATALRLGRAGYGVLARGPVVFGTGRIRLTVSGWLVGSRSHCVALDIAREGVLAELVDEVGQRHPWLFALVNNAAVMYPEPIRGGRPGPHPGTVLHRCAQHDGILPGGCSANAIAREARDTSSTSAPWRADRTSTAPTGVAKLAVNHLGRTLRRELEGDDIRVTTVIPGGFATNLARGFSASGAGACRRGDAEKGL